MKIYRKTNADIIKIIKNGGIGVLATDTIYGLVAPALQKESVERVYAIRRRDADKPMIILISSIDDLDIFNIRLSAQEKKKISSFWPGQVSVILPCPGRKWEYLHRGTQSLAFRCPQKADLAKLIKKAGPLLAPSANMAGKEPAKTIEEAQGYFGNSVDFYVDEGEIIGQHSTIIKLEGGEIVVKRRGAVKIDLKSFSA